MNEQKINQVVSLPQITVRDTLEVLKLVQGG